MLVILITAVTLISAGIGQCPDRCHCTRYITVCTLAKLNRLPSRLQNSTEFLKIELDRITELNSSVITNTGLTNLTRLVLKDVQLQEIQPRTFQAMNVLESLSITYNNITELKSDSFRFLDKLYYLDLSNNNISYLNSKSFSGLTNIRHLYLRQNKIEYLPANIFQDMKNRSYCGMLKTPGVLDLSGNHKSYSVENGVFQNVCTFTHFNLGSLSSENITKYGFVGLTRAMKLSFSSVNKVTNILNGLSGLKHLEMTDGQITYIETNAFESMKFLNHLDLSNNLIHEIRSGVFKGLASVKTLILDLNRLYALKTDGFQHLESLEQLELLSCNIRNIEPGAFDGLLQLQTLNLINNYIVILKNNTFCGLPRLRELMLDENEIKIIERGAFNGLRSLKTISHDMQSLIYYFSCREVNGKGSNQITVQDVSFEMLERLDTLQLIVPMKSFQGIQLLKYLFVYMDGKSVDLQQELQNILGTVQNVTVFMLKILSVNSFEALTRLSSFQISHLHVQASRLPVLNSRSFAGFLELKYLAIENCGTLIIEKNAFHQMKSLKEVEILLNCYIKIKAESFSQLNNLRKLDFFRNQIISIERGSFQGLTNLKTLFLSNNNLKYLNVGSFQGLDNVEEIYLQNNDLEEINAGVFGAVCDEKFELSCKNTSLSSPYCNASSALRTLKLLHLAENKIAYIHPHAFILCINLLALIIDGNSLLTLDNNFLYSPALTVFSMINCNVTGIPNNTFECTPFLSHINLSINANISKLNVTPLLHLKGLRYITVFGRFVYDCAYYETWLWLHRYHVSYYFGNISRSEEVNDNAIFLNLGCNATFQIREDHNTSITANDFLFFKQYIEPIILIFILISGLFFNGFLFFVSLHRSDMCKKQNACIIHLAIVDLLSLILNLPLSYWDVVNVRWELGETMCKVFILSKDIIMGLSILSVIALSVERYLVAGTFSSIQKRCDVSEKVPTAWLLLMAWISSIVLSLPSYFPATINIRCMYCPPGNQDYIKRVWTFQFVMYYLLPAVAIIYLNVMTSIFMKKSVQKMPGEIKNTCQAENRRITANMVLILAVVFVICYAPNFILRLLVAWSVLNIENIFLVAFFSFCLVFCNTIFNPISVFIMSSKYKYHFLRYFPFIKKITIFNPAPNLKRAHAIQRKPFENKQTDDARNAERNINFCSTSSVQDKHTTNIQLPGMECLRRLKRNSTGRFNKVNKNVAMPILTVQSESQENVQTNQSFTEMQDNDERIQQARMERLAKLQKRFM